MQVNSNNPSLDQALMRQAEARDNWQNAFNKRIKKVSEGQFSAQLQAPELEEKKDKAKPKAEPEQKDAFTASKPEPDVGYKIV